MASQLYDGTPLESRTARTRRRVLIADTAGMPPIGAVVDVLARCRVRAWRVSSAATVRRSAPDGALALVGVAAQPVFGAPALDDVRHLDALGYTVLCYAEGASAWPLGVQCRMLLAGASHVFDSASPTFAEDLQRHVLEMLNAALERSRETLRIRNQMTGLGIVGTSARMTALFRWLVGASAVSDVAVLIHGETGTGKELAARAIHRLDPRRRNGPFVPVNCGAISASLSESELFGHRRGAFTGAERARPGLIRAASGGVLFLDEIGDLELNLQAKLLRVLQERRVLAVGDDQESPVDVRVIAATNRQLEDMVRCHAFRADLFHRLNVLSIRIPPLRERPEDIEPLVEHFLARSAQQASREAIRASAEFIEALRHVHLPGNVRQLENVICRAVVTASRGDSLQLRDLPPDLWLELSKAEAQDAGADAAAHGGPATTSHPPSPVNAVAVLDAVRWNFEGALDLCELHIVAAALGASSGNKSRAARLLGISPRCIFNKMRKHRLSA